jgi:hypothetical protein
MRASHGDAQRMFWDFDCTESSISDVEMAWMTSHFNLGSSTQSDGKIQTKKHTQNISQ